MSPSFIMHELHGDIMTEEHVDELLALSEKADAILIGPGLGRDQRTMDAVSLFLQRCRKPMTVDADAIYSIGDSRFWYKMPMVFTPHQAELRELLSHSEEEADATAYAATRGDDVTIVAKGAVDEVTNGRYTKRNTYGTPAMTVGGTGDSLAGIIAGLLAKGMDGFNAGCVGAFINSRAGEMAFARLSYGMTAPDVIECVPLVLRENLV